MNVGLGLFHVSRGCAIILLFSLAIVAPSVPLVLWSQSSDQPHIVPRPRPAPKPPSDAATGPGEPALEPGAGRLRTTVDFVLVPTTVMDAMNRPVTDLDEGDFALFEDGLPQRIQYFSKEDQPISIGILLDFSASMANKFVFERTAVEQFARNANPLDDYFVIAFSDAPHLIADTTQSIDELQDKLALAVPAGNTSLLDAIFLGLQKLRSAQYQRRALVIISDGGDNHSYYNSKVIRKLAEETDVLIYSIGLFDNMPVPLFKTIEEKLGKRILTKLTDATGGRTIAADHREKLPEIAAAVSQELREQYVLGYRPTTVSHDSKWRKISVRVSAREGAAAPLHTHNKQGYIAAER